MERPAPCDVEWNARKTLNVPGDASEGHRCGCELGDGAFQTDGRQAGRKMLVGPARIRLTVLGALKTQPRRRNRPDRTMRRV